MHEFMEKLVEKASARILVQKKVNTSFLKKSKATPDIVIDRDPGSGGRLVAKLVAKKLHWKLLDEKLMNELADELGIPRREFADVDEHTRGWLMDSLHSLFNPNYVNDLHYIAHLKKLILHANKSDDVVILGRGANHILPADKCLRVRVTASFTNRVKNTVKHEGKSLEDATEWVKKVEGKRVHFVKQYFGVNPYNPWHYDVVINTDTLSLDQAADLVVAAYFAKFSSEKRRLAKQLA